MSILRSRLVSSAQSTPDLWDDLVQRIRNRQITPILADSVYRLPLWQHAIRLFDQQLEINSIDGVDQEIIGYWAGEIGYPFVDAMRLATVVQFYITQRADELAAKQDYLDCLKQLLVDLCRKDPELAEQLEDEIIPVLHSYRFSELVRTLSLNVHPTPEDDPLHLLAGMQLPLYVTTSPHEFLEDALRNVGRTPRTRICFWRGEFLNVAEEHRADRDEEPTPESPIVYHLHGHEAYPLSLVLSEDDHMDFLMRIAQDRSGNAPLIPAYLRTAMSVSSLLLVGYRLQDWEFRSLFRGLIAHQQGSLRITSLALQLDPEAVSDRDKARAFLEGYFKEARFQVHWDAPDQFVKTLWKEYRSRG